ncbi:MAG: SulP family inorganic anion transporter [Fibrobacterota bacterium]
MPLLNHFNRSHFPGDLLGGVTAAIISLPMALAFGIASGVGPEAGLYGAVLIGLFASLFGGTPTLISEPTGPMTVVMTTVVTAMIAADPEHGLAMAFAVVILAGFFQVLFGLLKLGKYITLMPYSVISGFMSGIGIILILLQIGPLLGSSTPKGGIVGTMGALPELISGVQPAELFLSATTLIILFVWPRIFKKWIPAELLALVAGTVLSLIYLDGDTVRRIGEIPQGLPTLKLPYFSPQHWSQILGNAAVLALLGSIDALLTSVVADNLTRTEHKSDKELIGQGIGNMVSGLFGGLPGAGATMGTVVNIQSGARTAFSGLIRAGILLIVIVWAGPITAVIPLAVLAGIACKVGINILDWSFLRKAHHISVKSAAIMYLVLLLTVFVDLITAVGVGIFISNMLAIERLTRLQSKNNLKLLGIYDEDEILIDPEDRSLLNELSDSIMLFYLSGAMVFGVSKAIARQQSQIGHLKVLILDLHDVEMMGLTISIEIKNLIIDAQENGTTVLLIRKQNSKIKILKKLDLHDLISERELFTSRKEAITYARSLLDGE